MGSWPESASFDDIEARAWVLAVWIVRDPQMADEIVVATSTFSPPMTGTRAGDEAVLLCEVRRRAMAAADALETAPTTPRRRFRAAMRPSDDTAAADVRAVMAALPERQRAAVELTLFGGLDVPALALALSTPQPAVVHLLTRAMRTLQPVLQRRAQLREEGYASLLA